MYEEVHIIAYYYKWGEKEILSLPIFKREKYIELISKQVKAENESDPDDEANTDVDSYSYNNGSDDEEDY